MCLPPAGLQSWKAQRQQEGFLRERGFEPSYTRCFEGRAGMEGKGAPGGGLCLYHSILALGLLSTSDCAVCCFYLYSGSSTSVPCSSSSSLVLSSRWALGEDRSLYRGHSAANLPGPGRGRTQKLSATDCRLLAAGRSLASLWVLYSANNPFCR